MRKRGRITSVCQGKNDLSKIPSKLIKATSKYISLNKEYLVNVCTEDTNSDGKAESIVIEADDLPEHKSVYFERGHKHYEDYDYQTNIHKYASVHSGQRARSAGRNKIEQQTLVMKMPAEPKPAKRKIQTSFGAIGIALNGVAFFNENAAPGHEIVDELFTFDQCSGHPQNRGMYHYHLDPVCLIRDLGGSIKDVRKTIDGKSYKWIEDTGDNSELLLGFLMDGYPVYGPIWKGEKDCNRNKVPKIDEYNGHEHCTEDFASGIYHYHVKTANLGGVNNPVFWITNKYFYGEPGVLGQ